MAETKGFLDAVITSASQGAAGAIIGAFLAAVTDPITNRLLVKRMTISEAIQDVDRDQVVKYFKTTLPLNFIKFPLFEVLNEVIRKVDIPKSMRGVVIGAIFTTATLPLTNYRYCKSVNEDVPWTSPKLWKAYTPTVIRDIIYANSRASVSAYMSRNHADLSSTASGRMLSMFLTVVLACVASAPGNEFRGYTLQNPETKKPMNEFFQPGRFVRSTVVGSLVMGTSLGIATMVGPIVQDLLPKLKDPKIAVALAAAIVWCYLTKKQEEAMTSERSKQVARNRQAPKAS